MRFAKKGAMQPQGRYSLVSEKAERSFSEAHGPNPEISLAPEARLLGEYGESQHPGVREPRRSGVITCGRRTVSISPVVHQDVEGHQERF